MQEIGDAQLNTNTRNDIFLILIANFISILQLYSIIKYKQDCFQKIVVNYLF